MFFQNAQMTIWCTLKPGCQPNSCDACMCYACLLWQLIITILQCSHTADWTFPCLISEQTSMVFQMATIFNPAQWTQEPFPLWLTPKWQFQCPGNGVILQRFIHMMIWPQLTAHRDSSETKYCNHGNTCSVAHLLVFEWTQLQVCILTVGYKSVYTITWTYLHTYHPHWPPLIDWRPGLHGTAKTCFQAILFE